MPNRAEIVTAAESYDGPRCLCSNCSAGAV